VHGAQTPMAPLSVSTVLTMTRPMPGPSHEAVAGKGRGGTVSGMHAPERVAGVIAAGGGCNTRDMAGLVRVHRRPAEGRNRVDWRGRVVTVCAGSRCLVTALTDWCQCRDRHGAATLIDLAKSDFARLAPPSQGVVWVTVGRAALPATDTLETP
jgi:hypothetical protein